MVSQLNMAWNYTRDNQRDILNSFWPYNESIKFCFAYTNLQIDYVLP